MSSDEILDAHPALELEDVLAALDYHLGRMNADRIRSQAPDSSDGPPGIWCVVANVAAEQVHGEAHEVRQGTKHFSPNTKVYCHPAQWGDGYRDIMVIGRHRGSSRLCTLVMPAWRLSNWRAKVVYHPHVVSLMEPGWERHEAESIVPLLQLRSAAEQGRRRGLATLSPTDALIFAAHLGLTEEVRAALLRGADADGEWGDWTPLTAAASHGHLDVVALLAAVGVDVQKANRRGETPGQLARRYEHDAISAWLARAGGQVP